jgi:DNA polymerase III epsilon subunit-like protein
MSETDPLVIVIDLETSGLDPQDCAILEVGAVLLRRDPGPAPEYHDHVALRPGARWEDAAEEVHGIPRAEAESPARRTEGRMLDDLLDWIEALRTAREGTPRVVFAGMNVGGFDLAFLRHAAARCGEEKRWAKSVCHRTIDLHSLAAAHALRQGLPCDRLHTDAVYEMLGMEPEPRPHRAITGARMEAEALRRIIFEP